MIHRLSYLPWSNTDDICSLYNSYHYSFARNTLHSYKNMGAKYRSMYRLHSIRTEGKLCWLRLSLQFRPKVCWIWQFGHQCTWLGLYHGHKCSHWELAKISDQCPTLYVFEYCNKESSKEERVILGPRSSLKLSKLFKRSKLFSDLFSTSLSLGSKSERS